MPASRSVCSLLVGACLLLLGSLPPACARGISEPGLCATQCVFNDLAGHAAALPLETPLKARLDVAPAPVPAAGDPRPLEVVSTEASPRAPPVR